MLSFGSLRETIIREFLLQGLHHISADVVHLIVSIPVVSQGISEQKPGSFGTGKHTPQTRSAHPRWRYVQWGSR